MPDQDLAQLLDGESWDGLPWGVITVDGISTVALRVGANALRLDVLAATGVLDVDPNLVAADSLNPLMAAGADAARVHRDAVRALRDGHATSALVALDDVDVRMPIVVADYVDFYCSINHATNMGRILRPDDEPLLPNWRELPVGYHGRSGTLAASGATVRRPNGLRPGDPRPTYGPTRRMDFELEVGMVVGTPSEPGMSLSPDAAAEHLFGLCLVNDWSARDIQGYEYRPLGPFLGKSFLTSIAPWIVPMHALAPALVASPIQDPTPAHYLQSDRDWAVPIELTVELQTKAMRVDGQPPEVIAQTDFRDMYWTLPQMLAHVTANGAHLRTGDLYASGTVSGTEPGTYGSMMELSWGGQEPVGLANGDERTFLEDGDRIVMRGRTPLPDGTHIDFGAVEGTVLPAT